MGSACSCRSLCGCGHRASGLERRRGPRVRRRSVFSLLLPLLLLPPPPLPRLPRLLRPCLCRRRRSCDGGSGCAADRSRADPRRGRQEGRCAPLDLGRAGRDGRYAQAEIHDQRGLPQGPGRAAFPQAGGLGTARLIRRDEPGLRRGHALGLSAASRVQALPQDHARPDPGEAQGTRARRRRARAGPHTAGDRGPRSAPGWAPKNDSLGPEGGRDARRPPGVDPPRDLAGPPGPARPQPAALAPDRPLAGLRPQPGDALHRQGRRLALQGPARGPAAHRSLRYPPRRPRWPAGRHPLLGPEGRHRAQRYHADLRDRHARPHVQDQRLRVSCPCECPGRRQHRDGPERARANDPGRRSPPRRPRPPGPNRSCPSRSRSPGRPRPTTATAPPKPPPLVKPK